MVLPEAAHEVGVGEDAAPALADRGCAGERRWVRREVEKNLPKEVLVVQRVGRRRRGIVAAHTSV